MKKATLVVSVLPFYSKQQVQNGILTELHSFSFLSDLTKISQIKSYLKILEKAFNSMETSMIEEQFRLLCHDEKTFIFSLTVTADAPVLIQPKQQILYSLSCVVNYLSTRLKTIPDTMFCLGWCLLCYVSFL
jgi:hypothetical protein